MPDQEVREEEDVVIDITEEAAEPDEADPKDSRAARLATMARSASTEAASLARNYRARRPLRRPPPVVIRTVTAVDLVRAEARQGPHDPVSADLLDEAARSAERGEVGRALELLAGGRAALVAGFDRAELVETARSLADELVDDDTEAAAALRFEADRAEGTRGQLDPIRVAVRSGLRHVGRQAAHDADRAASTAATVLGAARLALALIALAAIAAWVGIIDASPGDSLRNLNNYVAVLAWSAIGVAVSLVLPFGRDEAGPAVDHLRSGTELAVRVVLGVTCALAAVAVLQSGIQEALDLTGAKAYPFAIAGGFSERLLDRRFRLG